jgi:hypothetical protein
MTALTVLLPAAWSPLAASSAYDPEKAWTVSASVAAYILPDAPDYLQPVVSFDQRRLHLEGRYNYEDLDTGSFFLGWNFNAGNNPGLRFTPIMGAVFGQTSGVAPGLLVDLSLGPVYFHSESEYLFDFQNSAADFFYSWSELGAHLLGLRLGISVQRTKVVNMPRVVATGPFLGISFWKLDATAYLFDPFDSTRYLVASLGITF